MLLASYIHVCAVGTVAWKLFTRIQPGVEIRIGLERGTFRYDSIHDGINQLSVQSATISIHPVCIMIYFSCAFFILKKVIFYASEQKLSYSLISYIVQHFSIFLYKVVAGIRRSGKGRNNARCLRSAGFRSEPRSAVDHLANYTVQAELLPACVQ